MVLKLISPDYTCHIVIIVAVELRRLNFMCRFHSFLPLPDAPIPYKPGLFFFFLDRRTILAISFEFPTEVHVHKSPNNSFVAIPYNVSIAEKLLIGCQCKENNGYCMLP